jgi:hypothetical protein
MVPDLVYKFQMICLRGTYVIEQKPNVGHTDWHGEEGRTAKNIHKYGILILSFLSVAFYVALRFKDYVN